MSAKKRRLRPPYANSSTSPLIQVIHIGSTTNADYKGPLPTSILRVYDENVDDVDNHQVFPVQVRRLNRKSSKQSDSTSTSVFTTKTDTSFHADNASNASSGLTSVSGESIGVQHNDNDGSVHLSTSATSEHSGSNEEDVAVHGTSKSLRAALPVVDRTVTVGALVDRQEAADRPILAVIGPAVISVIIILTFAVVCLLLMFYRRSSRRSRDVVGDRANATPAKSGLAIACSEADEALSVGRLTCLTKLLDAEEETPEITRLHGNDFNNHLIASSSSSSSHLRWYRDAVDGGTCPTSGHVVPTDTRYSMRRGDVSETPETVVAATGDWIQDDSYNPTPNTTENHVTQDASFDRIDAETEPGLWTESEQWYTRNGLCAKKFPRMGCGRGSSSNSRSCSRDLNDWLPLSSGRIEDDSMLAMNGRHHRRFIDGGGSRQSARVLYAPLQRSDTTISGLWYSHVDTAF